MLAMLNGFIFDFCKMEYDKHTNIQEFSKAEEYWELLGMCREKAYNHKLISH